MKQFDGNGIMLSYMKCGVMTNEGPTAFQEAIDFLKKAKPVETFDYDGLLEKAA